MTRRTFWQDVRDKSAGDCLAWASLAERAIRRAARTHVQVGPADAEPMWKTAHDVAAIAVRLADISGQELPDYIRRFGEA